MRVHGFTIPLKLARGGLVRVMPVRVNGLEFARLKISDAGRAALTAPKPFRIDKVSGMSRKIEGASHVRCSRASRSPRYARASRVRTALAELLRAHGIKRGPSNLAFQVALDSGDDNLRRRQCQAWDRVSADLRSLLANMEIARAEMITAMFREYRKALQRALNPKEG
jgi:hypothetical protein